jgi:putative hydrolase of the HAD superfamily
MRHRNDSARRVHHPGSPRRAARGRAAGGEDHLAYRPVRALILDYGEVLSHPQRRDCLQQMAARAGTDVERFGTAYWRYRRAYDGGLAASEYWYRVLDTLGTGKVADAGLVDVLIADDIRSWTHYREDVWEFARAFRAAGGRTAFLSNGVPEIVGHLRRTRALDTSFDAVLVSCEVGYMKPAPEIFRLCLERLGGHCLWRRAVC